MRQVRQSVFETNSSSTHCMCIVSDRKAELVFPGRLRFSCEEYGRERGELRSAEDKASYLYSSILSLFERKKAENAKSWIMEELDENPAIQYCGSQRAALRRKRICHNFFLIANHSSR